MALYRAQILLEETQHDELERLARDSGRSMSELVREVVADYLARASDEESAQRSLAAVDELAQLRQRIQQKHGCLAASLLDELRDERDVEIAP
jgi:metal-responsive CopG/Arc/MetJ family transcriptional regulator